MSVRTSAVDELADRAWDALCAADPLQATVIGEHAYDDRLPDLTRQGREATVRGFESLLAEAQAMQPEPEQREEALTLSALRGTLQGALATHRADPSSYNVDVMWGLQTDLQTMSSYSPYGTPEEGRVLLERWRGIAPTLDQLGANLRAGLAEGLTPVRTSAERVIDQLRTTLDGPPEDDGFLAPLTDRPEEGWSDGDWDRFAAELQRIVDDAALPALRRYMQVVEESLPRARPPELAGIGNLPGGAELYRAQVRASTTTDLDPEQIHATGLDEVERIDGEMTELGRRVLGAESLAATQAALRDDPGMHFDTGDEIVEVAERSLARAQAATPQWFGRLPRTPCVVTPMLAAEQEHSTVAYYRDPAADGSRPGTYYVNTSHPETRPRYEAEALAFHEAVPGHHTQVALAQEMADLPAFRRFSQLTAYVEGWGLYTERLSDEMGLYSGDVDRLGMLSFDAWRACRLVVDTGMHALGWSRDRAIGFMLEHSALAPNNIANEVDRYIGRPAQALAYKIGQLAILRLRGEHRDRLGSAFDIRAFHDAILGHGPLPLSTLAEAVAADLG
ncbi:MAG TPA: DUF885 domain-containing protein [Candidatus Limnocylindria bacterium]